MDPVGYLHMRSFQLLSRSLFSFLFLATLEVFTVQYMVTPVKGQSLALHGGSLQCIQVQLCTVLCCKACSIDNRRDQDGRRCDQNLQNVGQNLLLLNHSRGHEWCGGAAGETGVLVGSALLIAARCPSQPLLKIVDMAAL